MSDYEMYTVPVKVVLGILSTLVSFCTIGGNLLVLVAFCIDRGVRISNNYFIISLAVTDVTIGLISLNVFILYILLGYWPLGNFICNCWLAIDYTACLVSQVTVFLITLDRFLSVKFPVKYRNWRSETKLKFILAISWLAPAALWTLLVFGWYEITGEPRPPSSECNVPFTNYTIFNTILTVSYFWVPLCFIISLYVGIYRVAAGLHQQADESHKGLANLVLMAGTTMSKIGLSAKVTEPPTKASLGKGTKKTNEQQDYVATRRLDSKSADTERRTDNGSSPHFQTEYPTECIDSGLGESNNNQRPQSDFGSLGLKRRTSSINIEAPEFCEHYRCISSPNAPPSQASSAFSECDDPWTRQSESSSAYRFEDRCNESIKHKQENADHDRATTSNTSSPQTSRPQQPEKEDRTKSRRFLASVLWPLRKLAYPFKNESHSMIKVDVSSSDSGKNLENQNNENITSVLASQQSLNPQSSIRDRFFLFQNWKSAEKHKTERRKRRRARKALRMISFILGAFVICWTPFHIVIIIKGFCDIPSEGYSCIDVHLFNFAYYMCYMNSPINPFCYAMANITFKRAFLRILRGDFGIK